VVRNKPADLTDGCWTGTTAPLTFMAEQQFFGGPGTSTCNTLYPAYGFPRLMAGMPLSNDIVKCRLRSIDPGDYAVPLTPDEVARLQAIFPDGVCNFSRPGVWQTGLQGTWMVYPDVGEYRSDAD
jgi:hypothetical protein